MATKTKTKKEKVTKKEIKLPEFKDLKKGDDGYRNISTVYDSEFLKLEKDEQFEGKFIEVIQAGKKGEEKPCALFQQKGTGKKYLIGNSSIMTAVEKYGDKEYRITSLGKKKSKSSSFSYIDFRIEVK